MAKYDCYALIMAYEGPPTDLQEQPKYGEYHYKGLQFIAIKKLTILLKLHLAFVFQRTKVLPNAFKQMDIVY